MQLPPVVTRAELAGLGRGRGYGDLLVARAALVRAAPSVYLQPGSALTARIDAALDHAGRDAVVTGWAGCVLLGLPYVVEAAAVPVLVPACRRRVSTPGVRVLPTRRAPRWWVTEDGVRVAAPARCVVDAARALRTLREVRALVLGALPLGGVDELDAELRAGARGGRALVTRALRDAEAGAASAPEAEAADLAAALVRSGRLPRYLLNADVLVDGVLVGRPDGYLVGLGLGWEVESREFHADDDGFERTLSRSDDFLAHGLSLLHVTPRRLRSAGSTWPAHLERAAAAAARAACPEPPGLVVRPRGPLLPLPVRRSAAPTARATRPAA